MKLFVLERLECGFDEIDKVAIFATSEKKARTFAFTEVKRGDQDSKDWLDKQKTTCVEVDMKKSGVVLESYCAG